MSCDDIRELGLAQLLEPSAIATDYVAVSDRMCAHFAELLTAIEDPTEREHVAEEFSSRPETMIAVLDHFDTKYGGAEAYLRHGGLTTEAIDSLRARLIER